MNRTKSPSMSRYPGPIVVGPLWRVGEVETAVYCYGVGHAKDARSPAQHHADEATTQAEQARQFLLSLRLFEPTE